MNYSKLFLWFILSCAGSTSKNFAQTKVPCNQITGEMGYKVRSVKINGRWVPKDLKQKVEQLVGVGQLFDPAKTSLAIEEVRNEIKKTEEQFAFQVVKGSTSVLYITADVCDVSTTPGNKEVEIVIHPYFLKIDLVNVNNNILPVPRSAKSTFYQNVPASFKILSPAIAFTNDRQYGQAIGLKTSTDLLHLPGLVNPNQGPKSLRLGLGIDAKKSIVEEFHTIGANLEIIHPVYNDSSMGWSLSSNYFNNSQPLGKGKDNSDLLSIRGSIQRITKKSFINRFSIGAGARFLRSHFSLVPGFEQRSSETGIEAFALVDGKPGKSFTRLAIGYDAAIPDAKTNLKNYQRLVSRIGYSFFAGSGHNNWHIETILGIGYSWGSMPAYNQFYAGNISQDFLYEPFKQIDNQALLNGPLIRSLGEKEGGVASTATGIIGGTSFWHLNTNIAIPVSKWAMPLIPDIVISEEPRVMTLRSALKAQSETTKNFILDDLVSNHNFPDNEETEAKADEIVNRDIRPTLNYLSDRANIYSIKPLILFDIGHLNSRELPGKTWTAAGLGIQLTIVIARLEAGYMYTISPSSDASKGNFFLRFVLQNFY
jgi:hypothetical protein